MISINFYTNIVIIFFRTIIQVFPKKADSVINDKYGLSPRKETGIWYYNILILYTTICVIINDVLAYKRNFASKLASQYGLSPSNVNLHTCISRDMQSC